MGLTRKQKKDTKRWTKNTQDELAVKQGCYFDENSAKRVINFFENYLRHTKGKWAGKPFELMQWQKEEVIKPVYGWLRPDGTRRFRMVYIEVPKKNGKSDFASGIGLYQLVGDGEFGAEVYCAATTREQAGIVYRNAANMVDKSPELKPRLLVTRSTKHIGFAKTQSFMKAISSDVGASEGMNISTLIFDEKHALKSREFWEALRYGGAARKQPLIFVITTAGWDKKSICFESHDYAKKVSEGIIEDISFFSYICAADKEDDWTDPKIWKKANPSLGITISNESFAQDCQEAQNSATKQNSFKRYRLNIWTEQLDRWLKMDKWKKCGGKLDIDSLKHKPCGGGLDIGSVSDLSALSLVFRREEGGFKSLWWFWAPEEKAAKRQRDDRVPYLTWAEQGFLTLTPGDETDYRFVRKHINEIADEFGIVDIAADRLFQGAQLIQDLVDDGLDMVPFGQGFRSMAAPTKEFENAVNRTEFEHGDNPVATWMASNVTVKMDEAGNIKPDKKRSGDKIDGVVASIMALGRLIVSEGNEGSVYNSRGIEYV